MAAAIPTKPVPDPSSSTLFDATYFSEATGYYLGTKIK
jgi:hypothetical protein